MILYGGMMLACCLFFFLLGLNCLFLDFDYFWVFSIQYIKLVSYRMILYIAYITIRISLYSSSILSKVLCRLDHRSSTELILLSKMKINIAISLVCNISPYIVRKYIDSDGTMIKTCVNIYIECRRSESRYIFRA